jgi:hypothetical protein
MIPVEALMWSTLEYCAKNAKGCPLDASDSLVAMLLEIGVLKRTQGKMVALTEQGQTILKLKTLRKAKCDLGAKLLSQPGPWPIH